MPYSETTVSAVLSMGNRGMRYVRQPLRSEPGTSDLSEVRSRDYAGEDYVVDSLFRPQPAPAWRRESSTFQEYRANPAVSQ
jgi:hypothetical protein